MKDEKLTLQMCIAGIKAALAERKFERAAAFVRVYFTLCDRHENNDDNASDAETAFFNQLSNVETEILDLEVDRVREAVCAALADAVQQDDSVRLVCFYKMHV